MMNEESCCALQHGVWIVLPPLCSFRIGFFCLIFPSRGKTSLIYQAGFFGAAQRTGVDGSGLWVPWALQDGRTCRSGGRFGTGGLPSAETDLEP